MNETAKVFHVVLTEDEITDLRNLKVTLQDNLGRLEDVSDFNVASASVADMVKLSLPAFTEVMEQLDNSK